MSDRNERWVLNHLIELCRDEELSLRYAADHVKDPSVKALFIELASQRHQFATDLVPHAQRLGGAEAGEWTTRGSLRRAWLALREMLVGNGDAQMIQEAEHSEDQALATYENVLEGMLPPTTRDLVEQQCAQIRMAHDRVRAFMPDGHS